MLKAISTRYGFGIICGAIAHDHPSPWQYSLSQYGLNRLREVSAFISRRCDKYIPRLHNALPSFLLAILAPATVPNHPSILGPPPPDSFENESSRVQELHVKRKVGQNKNPS